MSDSISVRCPACQARLTIKDSKLRGRKITCPKCSKSFIVPASTADSDDDFLDELEAHDAAASSPSGRLPPRRTTGGPKKASRRSGRPPWLIPGLIGGGLLLVGGVSVAVVVAVNLSRGWFGKGSPDDAGPAPQTAQGNTPVPASQTATPSATPAP